MKKAHDRGGAGACPQMTAPIPDTGTALPRAQAARSSRLVPGEGVEPSRCCQRRILSPLRLPFRHPGWRASPDGAMPERGK
jgi:hypothetical protein